MKRTLMILAVLPLVVSCGLYGKYTRPQIEDIDITEDIEIPSWRSMFKDPCLQDLIDTALTRNTDLASALLGVRSAEISLKQAKLGFLPSVSASTAPLVDDASITAGVSSWELDVFGKQTAQVRSQKSALEGSRAYSQAVQAGLVATLADSYYSLMLLDKELDISRQTLQSWDKSIQVLESLKLAGKSNDVAVQQARAKRLGLEASALAIEKNISVLERSICTLMGVPAREIRRGNIDEQEFESLPEVPVLYLANRPDVRQSEMDLAKAFYATKVARASFYPSITLSGTLRWTTDGDFSVTDPAAWLGIAESVFLKGSVRSSYKKAQIAQDQALLDFRQTLLDAGNEVADALVQCRTAEGKHEIHLQQTEALQQAVDKIGLRMIYSNANYLEVLTAQQSLLDAQLLLAQDQYDRIQGLINLYRSLGGGVD